MKKNIAGCMIAYMICSFAVVDCMIDITSLEEAIPINLNRALTELENCKTNGLEINPAEEEQTQKMREDAERELNRKNDIEGNTPKPDLEKLNDNLLREGGKWFVKFDQYINNAKKTQDEDYYNSIQGKEMYDFKIVTNIKDLPEYKNLPRRWAEYYRMNRLKTLPENGYTVTCLIGKPKWDGLNSIPWAIAIIKKEGTLYLLCNGLRGTEFYKYGVHVKELLKEICAGEKIQRVITDPVWYTRTLRISTPSDWPMTDRVALKKRQDDLWKDAGYGKEHYQDFPANAPNLLVDQTDEKGRDELHGFLKSVLGPFELKVRNVTPEFLGQ